MKLRNNPSLFLPLFCAYLGHIIWGISNLFTKLALEYTSPNVLLSMRFGLSAILMVLWMVIRKRKFTIRGKNVWSAVLLVTMQVAYYVFESYGIKYTNATVSGVVLAVVPVFAMILAIFFLKEYPTRRQAIFCIFPTVGVIMMTLSASALGVIRPVGILLLILTCLSSAIYKNANRKASEDFDSFDRSFLVLTASFLVFTVWAFADGKTTAASYFAPLKEPLFLLAVLVLGLLCSLAANLLVNYAVSRMQVVKLSSFGAVSTLVSMFSGVIFLKEPMNFWMFTGAILILWGVHQVTRPATAAKITNKTEEEKMYDLVIRGGLVYDGLGNAPKICDVAVKDGVIVRVGEIPEKGTREIDAKGLSVTPGFIDSHSHGDGSVRKKPLMDCVTEQGITTALTGQCGSSIYPVPSLGPDQSAKEFFDELKKHRSGMNFALFVGHSALRKTVMGKSMNEPTPEEMAQMKKLLADGLKEGAMGLSLGLGYVPSIYSKKEELYELAQVVKEYGGVIAAHIRNESDFVVEAVQEFIDVANSADLVGVISHFKACKVRNHGKVVRMMELVDEAVAQGHPIYMDVYPYVATSTSLNAPFVTKELQSLPTEQIMEELKKPEVRAAQQAWAEPLQGSDLEFAMVVGAKKTPQHLGKRVSEIAKEQGKKPYDALYDLLIENNMVAKAVYFSISEEDMMQVMRHPRCMIGTDGGNIAGLTHYHPRNRGTFPRVLGKYVREKGVTSLEEMIRKMTSLPASVYGFAKKGKIAEGMDADLCIFDAAVIRDKASFVEPGQRNVGLNYVIVGGEITVENNVKNDVLSGKFVAKA